MTGQRSAESDWAGQAKKNAGWLMALGIMTVIAGVFAIASPAVAGSAVALFVGVALAIGGVARLVGVFSASSFGQGALAFLGGGLATVVGVIMVARPGLGLATLTLMLAMYLLFDGIFGTILAFHVRPEKGWGWLFFSGALTVVLGVLITAEWPLSGVWAIGTLVGINLLFSGMSMITLGSAARVATKVVESAA